MGKINVHDHNVEAYHVDEHKFGDARKLRTRLLDMLDDEAQHVTIILFMSPHSLSRNPDKPKQRSDWCEVRRIGKGRTLVPILH